MAVFKVLENRLSYVQQPLQLVFLPLFQPIMPASRSWALSLARACLLASSFP